MTDSPVGGTGLGAPVPPPNPPRPPSPIADGWYPDPGGSGRLRWWENGAWTPWVSEGRTSVRHPLPAISTQPALARFPARAALWGIVGVIAAIALAGAGAALFDSAVWSLVAGVVGLYAPTTVTVWWVSRRYGTGNLVRDIGFRFRWADIGGGIAASIAGRALGLAVAVLVIAARDLDSADPSPGQFDAFESSDLAIVLAVLAAVIAAPVFEELFFRGFLQATLETRLGPWWAIAIASTLFGAAHLSPDNTTTGNLVILAVTGVAGVTLGFAYWATRRLGTAIVGHALFNLVAAVVLLVDRFA